MNDPQGDVDGDAGGMQNLIVVLTAFQLMHTGQPHRNKGLDGERKVYM